MKHRLRRCLNNYIKRSHWYNEVLFWNCRKFWELQDEQFDVVNLGSTSGVYDFCYDSCGLKGANWAIGPQSTIGDFVILKQYRKHIKDDGIVIYPLCPFTAISGAVPYLAERCYSFVDYRSFPGGHYITSSKIQAAKDNPLSIYPVVECFRDIVCHLRGNQNVVRSEAELAKDAIVKMKGWSDQFGIKDLNEHFLDRFDDVYRGTVKMIIEIINYCDIEGLKLVFVFPPVYRSLAGLFTPAAREQLLDSFIMDASQNRVKYYNLIDDPVFSEDRKLFKDSYYLNEIGAQKFTKYLINLIESI